MQTMSTIEQGFQFSGAKDLGEIPMESHPTRAQNRGGMGQNRRFSTNKIAMS